MKKICTLLISGALIAASVSPANAHYAFADSIASVMPIKAEEPGRIAAKDPSDKALEAAIKEVKAKITVPQEYSQFDYYFYGSYSDQSSYWTLNWRNPTNSSYIQVNCDLDNHIVYYGKFDNSNTVSNMPKYLKKELKGKAEEFINKIAPSISSKLEYVNDTSSEGYYSGTYLYTFQRKENGVSFPDNNVSIWVDNSTGEVQSAAIGWLYEVAVPSADTKWTKEQAADLIKKNLNMKLSYRTNYYRIYDGRSSSYEKKAFLVYEPDNKYISVDAKTGEVYLSREEWVNGTRNTTGVATKEEAAMASDAGGSYHLTDEELAKVSELEKLITKERAIELVTTNPYLLFDKNLIAYTAYLNKAYSGSDKSSSYVWFVELTDNRPVDYKKDKDTYRAYANATVDAMTGKILSYNASVKNNYDEKTGKWKTVKIPYDKAKGLTIIEKFLKAQIKDQFNNSKLTNQSEDYIAYYKNENTPVYGGYQYQYTRVNEGVEYPYNGIYGSVDGVTGKIYSYYSNWENDIKFESPKGAMTSEEAFKKYIANEGYQLMYEINEVNLYDQKKSITVPEKLYEESNSYEVKPEIRLVYRPDVNPPYLSPFTGEQLNSNGEVYKKTKPYVYKDIEDTAENREILMLSDMNIGFEGEYFYPTKAITMKELNELMEKIGYGWYDETQPVSDMIMTRQEIALNLVKKLGLEKVASIEGIYKTGFGDETDINPKYLGAVAIAKGLGLMKSDASNNFNPKGNVTRADAAHLILNFIKVQRNGMY